MPLLLHTPFPIAAFDERENALDEDEDEDDDEDRPSRRTRKPRRDPEPEAIEPDTSIGASPGLSNALIGGGSCFAIGAAFGSVTVVPEHSHDGRRMSWNR